VDRDRPLRYLGVEIPRTALPLLVGALAGLTKGSRPFPCHSASLCFPREIVDAALKWRTPISIEVVSSIGRSRVSSCG
jgi:hypothetical protein